MRVVKFIRLFILTLDIERERFYSFILSRTPHETIKTQIFNPVQIFIGNCKRGNHNKYYTKTVGAHSLAILDIQPVMEIHNHANFGAPVLFEIPYQSLHPNQIRLAALAVTMIQPKLDHEYKYGLPKTEMSLFMLSNWIAFGKQRHWKINLMLPTNTA
jgi:hypothetical protein